jgi:hypothetical protein
MNLELNSLPTFGWPTVVPAKAGTHTPRRHVVMALPNHSNRWFWVPAFAGTTRNMACSRCKVSRPTAQPLHSRAFLARIASRSRGAFRPGYAVSLASSAIRGRREDRVRAAPAVSCAKCASKNAHEHTGSAEAVRPSLRNGFTAYFELSPVTGFLATVACGCCRQLDASTGASGPHDFAVRVSTFRQIAPSRPPHPAPRQ